MKTITLTTDATECALLTETGARWAALAVRELEGTRCYCGAKKQGNQSFCRDEYYALPPAQRQALYRRIGDGYEEAYKNAREYLREAGKK
jgi:hypothetical protein